jgi:hypothetical protein
MLDCTKLDQAIAQLERMATEVDCYSFNELTTSRGTSMTPGNFFQTLSRLGRDLEVVCNVAQSENLKEILFNLKSVVTEAWSEENIEVFGILSPLISSVKVRPDIWHCVKIQDKNIPVLMMQLVSGTSGFTSLQNTFFKSYANTIDLIRLFMNICDTPISKLSSIIIPNDGPRICCAMQVTVRWLDSQFSVSLSSISKDRFFQICEEIMKEQLNFLKKNFTDIHARYLVRLPSLPADMTQLDSLHCIVVEHKSKQRILKFTPRIIESDWIKTLIGRSVPGAVMPRDIVMIEGMENLVFVEFPLVLPPLTKVAIRLCFNDFVLESALALHRMHTKGKIFHGDVRAPNIGFQLCADGTAQAVFIDIDRGGFAHHRGSRNSPAALDLHRDWVQWAKMIKNLLVGHPVQELKFLGDISDVNLSSFR